MIYTKTKDGKEHKIEVMTVIDERGKVEMYVDNTLRYLKVHYRHERTLDDHMGNTSCGYYCNVPIGKETKRIYIHENGWQ